MPRSQNGYTANDINLTTVYNIPGTRRQVRLRKGPAGELLVWLASQFDKRVEDIDAGQLDDWGYAERPIRGGTELSNHASGTAIDLNATKHPLGKTGTFTKTQVAEIRKILAEAGGCVRWGGDYIGRKDEMHFEIVASEAECRARLAKLRVDGPREWWEKLDAKTKTEIKKLMRQAISDAFDVKKLTDGSETDVRILVQWMHKHVTDIKADVDWLRDQVEKQLGKEAK